MTATLIGILAVLALLWASSAYMADALNAIHQIDGDSKYVFVPVFANEVVPPGTGVMALTADGFARKAADTAAARTLGIVEPAGQGDEDTDNTGGANGAISIRVRTRGRALLTAAAPDQTWMSQPVYWADNQTVTLVGGSTNNILAGYVTAFDTAANQVEIELAGLGRLAA